MDKYNTLMTLSLTYGGFMIIAYLIIIYSTLWGETVYGDFMPRNQPASRNIDPYQDINRTETNVTYERNRTSERMTPAAALTSPLPLLLLCGGILSIANGLAIRSLTHREEIKKVRKHLTSTLLTPEEKHVIDEIEKSNGELTQKELTERTGYTRVKTHRIIQKLESKKIIRKIPYGQTNKILMETE